MQSGVWSSEEELAQKAKQKGYNTITLELDDFDNGTRWPAFKAACDAQQIMAVPWYKDAANTRYCPVDATNVISQVESHDARQNALASYPLLAPNIHKAIITDFNGFRDSAGNWLPELAIPFNDQNVTCITESYLPDGPTHSPEQMNWSASVKLGFKKVCAAFGVYEGNANSTKPGQLFTLQQDYAQWLNDPAYWVWLAESPTVL